MKLIKEYMCDNRTPSDYEITKCLKIVKEEDCIVKLMWFYPYSGWYNMTIRNGMTFEDCKAQLPECYPV